MDDASDVANQVALFEDDSAEREELAEPFATLEPIGYFGTDFDVHGLVRRLNAGDIEVPNFDPPGATDLDLAGFQRAFVWRKYQMDRFIESLLLGYPVPGIFLVQQPDNRLLVLDGQQRLRTLQRFYEGELEDGSPFVLENVADDLKGLAYATLGSNQRRSLDNTFIHATVIKYDPLTGGDESIYQLFERLNASGSNLYPHEIRVALYPGRLVEFIGELNNYQPWREIYGGRSPRLKDHEQILRFLALYVDSADYKKPLKGFLNDFVKRNRDMSTQSEANLRSTFEGTCDAIAAGPGGRAFRSTRQINAALVDSVMVGMARRLEAGPITRPDQIEPALESLLADEEFVASIARATADEERVSQRLQKATQTFASIA